MPRASLLALRKNPRCHHLRFDCMDPAKAGVPFRAIREAKPSPVKASQSQSKPVKVKLGSGPPPAKAEGRLSTIVAPATRGRGRRSAQPYLPLAKAGAAAIFGSAVPKRGHARALPKRTGRRVMSGSTAANSMMKSPVIKVDQSRSK